MNTSKPATFTPGDVAHIAKLANIPITKDEEKKLADGFNTTIDVVNQLFTVDVTGIPPMGNVTGLGNVFRDDIVDEKRMFSQEKALMNAKRTHNGYFVVKQVVER